MRGGDRVWNSYEAVLKRMIAGVETSEVKYFAGICVDSVLRIVDWYYNDHLEESVWVYRIVNSEDP